jgi:hypothetical protein
MDTLKFLVLTQTFTLHRLQPGAAIPKAVFASPFYSISRSDEELSLLVPETLEIASEKSEPGWRALKVAGPLDFSLTGILAGIAGTLARAGISIFAISTFDTDYILVKNENLKAAREALTAAGHRFGRTPKAEAVKEDGFVRQSYNALLEKQIPLIKELFTEKLGPGALATLRSEAALTAAVGGLYEFLPAPVRLVANRDIFVSFCVHNLDKILPEAPLPKAKNKKAR